MGGVVLLLGGAPVSNKVSEGGYQNFMETPRGGDIHFTTYRNTASLAIRGLLVKAALQLEDLLGHFF